MAMSHFHPTKVLLERIADRVIPLGPDECWLWPGADNGKGYGLIKVPKTRENELVSRVVAAAKSGLVDVRDVDTAMHICDNPPCCNPNHIKDGTRRENVDDMIAKDRTQRWRATTVFCQNMHEYTSENTRWVRSSKGVLVRRCVTCRTMSNRKSEMRRCGVSKKRWTEMLESLELPTTLLGTPPQLVPKGNSVSELRSA